MQALEDPNHQKNAYHKRDDIECEHRADCVEDKAGDERPWLLLASEVSEDDEEHADRDVKRGQTHRCPRQLCVDGTAAPRHVCGNRLKARNDVEPNRDAFDF